MRQSVFYPAIFGYTLGVFGRSFFLLSFSLELCLAFCFLVGLFLIAANGLMRDDTALQRYSFFFIVTLGLLFAALGALRYSFFNLYQGDSNLAAAAGKNIRAEGVVVAEPDERTDSIRLTVALDTLIMSGSRIPLVPTKVIMSVGPNVRVNYGDRISVSGAITRPENFAGDNGRIFDYISYLAKDRILYEINYPKVAFISGGHGDRLESAVLFLKNKFLEGLDAVVPVPESSLGAGLVIAGKRALPAEIQDEFERTGTIQVIVLSGYNVTVVAETLASIFSFLPAAASAAFSVGGIVVFTVAAGATATVVRAGIMALIVIAAKLLRRRYDVLRALIFSAFVMLVANPLLLVFDPSFQLSFIATFGLVAVSPMIEKYFLFLPETLAIRGTAVATVATQVFVLPFLLYLTGMFSLVAVPANLLIFLFIPITMLFCFVSGLLGALGAVLVYNPLAVVVQPLSFFAAVPATALLHYELFIVRAFASLPFASFSVPAFPAWVMFFAYACYAVVVVRFYRMKRRADGSSDGATMALIKGFHPASSSPAADGPSPTTSEIKF